MIPEGPVTDTLNLPGVRTKKHIYSNGQHTYLAAGIEPKPAAPCCLLFEAQAVKNGTSPRMFIDTTRDNKPAIIHYDLQKWKCRACGATPQEHLVWVEPGHGFTLKAADAIYEKAISGAFSKVAGEFGIQAKTVAELFTDRAIPAVKEIKRRTPRVLGLDEKYLWRDFRATFANVEESTLLWLLPKRDDEALEKFFDEMPDRSTVEVIVIDMYWPYKRMLNRWFPGRAIVVDKFHILRYATMAINTGRAALKLAGQTEDDRRALKRCRYTLLKRRMNWKAHDVRIFAEIAEKWPEMAELYEWKEAAHDLFDRGYGQEGARRAYDIWLTNLPPKFRRFFRRFTNNMRDERWGNQIFNYFDHPYTNAYTERLNGMIDDANRIGRGYPFRTLFLKAMLQFGVKRPPPQKLIKAREILDGIDVPNRLPGYVLFGLWEIVHLPLSIWRAWRAVRARSDDLGPSISTLAEGFRDPSRW